MVETAVRHAVAAQSLPEVQEPAAGEKQPSEDAIAAEDLPVEAEANGDRATAPPGKNTPPSEPESFASAPSAPEKTELEKTDPEKTEMEKTEEATEPALKNPRFWSAAIRTSASANHVDESAESIPVPLELRNLQKCKACGFPVSQGRTFCVECEEKQWRGQPLQQATASVVAASEEPHPEMQQKPEAVRATDDAPEISVPKDSSSSQTSSQTPVPATAPANGEAAIAAPEASDLPESSPQTVSSNDSASDNSTLFLSSAAPSESWLAANKYVLGVLLVVAIVIGVIAWLR